MVARAAEGAVLGEDPARVGEVLDGRDLPGQVVQTDRAARRTRRRRTDREQAQVVVVVATGRAHEHGLATELAGHDLEAEDARVELGRRLRVAHEQDGVIQPGDRDAHGLSLRHRAGGCHAASGTVAGAPTSFQPDCQLPPLAIFSVMLRKARPSS